MTTSRRKLIAELAAMAESSCIVETALYDKYDVKLGLRDVSGKGVLAGLTRIGEVQSHTPTRDPSQHGPGCLVYRGMDIRKIVHGFLADQRPGFEEVCYLLMFGELPDAAELNRFEKLLFSYRKLPDHFVHDAILKPASRDIMIALAQSVLALYNHDDNADDVSIENVLRQSLQLIAMFPLLTAYCYRAYAHKFERKSLILHTSSGRLRTAENFLRIFREDGRYSKLEAELLDLSLVLHAEHGGGNNSSFTTHVVTSTGTDTYFAMAAALASLKGPRHGGAVLKVVRMFDDMKKNVSDWNSDSQVAEYLQKLLNKEAFDRAGLIYGIGHAVYSVSDPRALILLDRLEALADEKGVADEMRLYKRVERLAPEIIGKCRKMYKGVSANVDFYSGFLYRMLNLPRELYTPLFAMARIVGWCTHRIEELSNKGKIIRPAYKSVAPRRGYVPLQDR